MRLFIFLLSLLFCSQESFGTPIISDVDWIEKLTADYSIALDTLNFAAISNIFSPNATLDFQNPKIPIVKGPDAIEKILAKLAPPGTISQHTVDSWSISFSNNEHASGTTYTISTYFGKDKLAGQILTFYGLFYDTFIKTDKAGYGGWRFNTRVLSFIGTPIGNPDIVPAV
ncbi:hypothetical protein MMC31_004994 [Peltigera leucophlebia]|nr:hypothetical protein [Peltigera leucophlebia]